MKRSERRAMREMLIVVALHQIDANVREWHGEASLRSWNRRLYGYFEINIPELSEAHMNALAALEYDGTIVVERWEETIDESPLTSHSFMICEAKIPLLKLPLLKDAMRPVKDEIKNGSFLGLTWDTNSVFHKYVMSYYA